MDGLDLEAFRRDLDDLRDRAKRSLGPRHAAHLAKMERWDRLCSGLGYATAWIAPNPLSAALLSQGRLVRWTMVAHHVSHRRRKEIETGLMLGRLGRPFRRT